MSSGVTASAEATTPLAWSRVFPARAEQVREARAFLRAALDGCPAADDAVLCISELAANAVLHSDSRLVGGTFTVRAEVHEGSYVWIEVEDNGGAWNQHAHSDGRPHGLDIVRALAADSGIDGDPITGWVTWARLDWPTLSPASHGKDTVPARDPAPAATTMTSAGQALTGLRAALAALGIATAGLTLTRHNGKLHPEHGPAIGYHGGLYWWAARRPHATRPIYAIHDATDPAGAARRIASGALIMPDTIPGHPHANAGTAAHSGAVHRGWFQHLQALEDAIAYRRARVSAPCPDCTAGGQKCDDHACDLDLIAEYQQTAIAAIQEASSQTP